MLTMDVRKVTKGDSRVINNFVFVYFPGFIEVWHEGQDVGGVLLEEGEVTTTQHLEEKAMWWLYEWNRI